MKNIKIKEDTWRGDALKIESDGARHFTKADGRMEDIFDFVIALENGKAGDMIDVVEKGDQFHLKKE